MKTANMDELAKYPIK